MPHLHTPEQGTHRIVLGKRWMCVQENLHLFSHHIKIHLEPTVMDLDLAMRYSHTVSNKSTLVLSPCENTLLGQLEIGAFILS